MATIINASTSNGLIQTADTSGILQLQSGGTTVATAQSTGFQVNAYSPATSLLTLGTAQTTTSGTSIDFTSIPSWVKRITVMFSGVSTNGSSQIIIQIGNSSVETSGYSGQGAGVAGATTTSGGGTVTNGFPIDSTSAATSGSTRDGMATICLLTGSTYVFNSVVATSGANFANMFGFSKTASSVIDRIRITTAGGANTFDAGSINILYE